MTKYTDKEEDSSIQYNQSDDIVGCNVQSRVNMIAPAARLSDDEVLMLRTHALHLQQTNRELTNSLAQKDKALVANEDKLERLQQKLDKKQAAVGVLEKIYRGHVDGNYKKHQTITKLNKDLQKLKEKHEDFKHDAAELIVSVTKQLEVLLQTRQPILKARGLVNYNEGYQDGGGFLGRHDERDAVNDLQEVRADERQASRILNERIIELFDLFNINIVPEEQ